MRDRPTPEIELSKTDFLRFLRLFNASADMQRAAAQEPDFMSFYIRDHGPVIDSYGGFHLWLLDSLGFRKEARDIRRWRREKLRELDRTARPTRPESRDDPEWMRFHAQKGNVERGGLLANEARAILTCADHPTLTTVPGRILDKLGARDDRRQRRMRWVDWAMLALAFLAAAFAAATLLTSYAVGRRLLHVSESPPAATQPAAPPSDPPAVNDR